MKTAILLILTIAVSSCTANVDSTLVGMFSTMVENAAKEAASTDSEVESEREASVQEGEQVTEIPTEPSGEEVFSELRALSESRTQIEEPQSTSNSRELSQLRDSHAERMSEKISNSGLKTDRN